MKYSFVLFAAFVMAATVLSLLTSGIELRIFHSKEWYIPLYVYLPIYYLVLIILFRIKFRRPHLFKIYVFRQIVKLNRLFNIFNIIDDKAELNSVQQKAIESWDKLVKDPESELQLCYSSGRRVVKKDSLIFILKSSLQESNIVIMKNNGVKMFYDVFIPQKNSTDMANLFDSIQEKKINLLIETEKKSIENILESF